MATLAELARHLNPVSGRWPPVILMTDAVRIPDPTPWVSRLAPGSLLIFRHYEAVDRVAVAVHLSRLCRRRRIILVIAQDFALAVRLAAGLHLPEFQARCVPARIRLWHRTTGRPLTAAAHGRHPLARAAAVGVDAALLSPVFATRSHPGARPLGVLALRRLARAAPIPVYALGGIDAATVGRLRGSGVVGVATVGGL